MKPGAGEQTVQLHCRISGKGEAVLLLHGLFGSGSNLGSLARHLQPYFTVLQVDLRNHGRSPHHSSMSYPDMAADLVRLLDTQGISRCAVVGHSMGGKVGMALAASFPQRVSALVVIDICPIAYPIDRQDAVLSALSSVPLEAVQSRGEVEQLLAQTIVEKDVRNFLVSNLRSVDGQLEWRFNLQAIMDSRAAIAASPVAEGDFPEPVLFIKGAQSSYISDACSASIKRLFPDASLKIIEGAGHWPHTEKPATLNALVERFLIGLAA